MENASNASLNSISMTGNVYALQMVTARMKTASDTICKTQNRAISVSKVTHSVMESAMESHFLKIV
jgi:hypothetical protein